MGLDGDKAPAKKKRRHRQEEVPAEERMNFEIEKPKLRCVHLLFCWWLFSALYFKSVQY